MGPADADDGITRLRSKIVRPVQNIYANSRCQATTALILISTGIIRRIGVFKLPKAVVNVIEFSSLFWRRLTDVPPFNIPRCKRINIIRVSNFISWREVAYSAPTDTAASHGASATRVRCADFLGISVRSTQTTIAPRGLLQVVTEVFIRNKRSECEQNVYI
jgi:hypothetical protein